MVNSESQWRFQRHWFSGIERGRGVLSALARPLTQPSARGTRMADETINATREIVTRREAWKRDLTRFFTGRPCEKGHVAERQTSNGSCVECRRDTRGTAEYRAKKKLRAERYRAKNPDVVRAQARKRYAETIDAHRAKRAANAEQRKVYQKAWREKNRPASALHRRARRARLRAAEGTHTLNDVKHIGERQKWKCHWCGKPTKNKYHIDHIKPLANGGANSPSNLAVACASCNRQKGATDPIAFAQRLGRLL